MYLDGAWGGEKGEAVPEGGEVDDKGGAEVRHEAIVAHTRHGALLHDALVQAALDHQPPNQALRRAPTRPSLRQYQSQKERERGRDAVYVCVNV
jgi:hypothetical protein